MSVHSLIGDGSGNHTAATSTFADIDSGAYSLTIPVVEGDKLLIGFECQWFHGTVQNWCQIRFTVAGTPIATQPTNGLFCGAQRADTSILNTFTWPYAVQAGDITAGETTIVVQYATNSGSLAVRNDGTFGLPLFRITNFGS